MQLDNQEKHKGTALKTIMSNPKLSKILQEGLASPIGSTKRMQARSVLSVIKKISGNSNSNKFVPKKKEFKDAYGMILDYMKDGQGGPEGTSSPLVPTMSKMAPTPTAPGFVANSTISSPGSGVSYGASAAPSWATAAGPEGISGKVYGTLENWEQKLRSAEKAGVKGLASLGLGALYGAEKAGQAASWIPYAIKPTPLTEKMGATSKDTLAGNLMSRLWGKDAQTPSAQTPSGINATAAQTPSVTPTPTPVSKTTASYVNPEIGETGFNWDNNGLLLATGPNSWAWVSDDMQTIKTGQNQTPGQASPAMDNPEIPGGTKEYPEGKLIATSSNTWLWIGNDGTVKKGDNGTSGVTLNQTSTGETGPTAETYTDTYPAGEPTVSSDLGDAFAGTAFEETWNGMSSSQKSALMPLIEMVNANYGPDMAAMIIQSDYDKMHALFPGIPDDQLPWGASYQQQVDDLSDRLKEEYRLNLLTNEKANLAKSGETLVQDLTKYIKGKDQYIEKVNGMIDRVENNMLQSSGIAGNTLNKQYLDYLYVLKGRQNSRYVTLVNDAVTRHDAMMADLDNEITNRTAQYREDLASGAEMLKTDYENMRATLASMYNSIAAAPLNDLAIQQAKADLYRTYSETASDAIKSTESGKTPFEEINDYKKNFLITDSSTGVSSFLPNIDLGDQVVTILQSGYSPEGVNQFLNNAIKTSYSSVSSLDEIKKGIEMINNYDEARTMDENGNVLVPKASLYQAMSVPIYNVVKNSVLENTEGIREVIKELSKKKPERLTSDEKAKFLNDYSNVIGDRTLLEAIWDYYVSTLQTQPGITQQEVFGNPGATDDELASSLASKIQYILM